MQLGQYRRLQEAQSSRRYSLRMVENGRRINKEAKFLRKMKRMEKESTKKIILQRSSLADEHAGREAEDSIDMKQERGRSGNAEVDVGSEKREAEEASLESKRDEVEEASDRNAAGHTARSQDTAAQGCEVKKGERKGRGKSS